MPQPATATAFGPVLHAYTRAQAIEDGILVDVSDTAREAGFTIPVAVIRAIEADLDAGRSPVIQLVSTGEALMERRIAEIPASEWDDINVDLTPRETVIEFLAHAFPVQLQEPFADDEGNIMSRPVFDGDGNPVICQEAAARRDALIEKLASLPPVPSALDQIVQHFGHDAVAEVTGRSRRVLKITDARGERLALRSRPASANLAETAAFMDGTKRILVFAMTGAEAFEAVMGRGTPLALVNGWRLARRRIMGADRVEIEGPVDGDTDALKRMGCTIEIVSWRARAFAPGAHVLDRILERWPLAA